MRQESRSDTETGSWPAEGAGVYWGLVLPDAIKSTRILAGSQTVASSVGLLGGKGILVEGRTDTRNGRFCEGGAHGRDRLQLEEYTHSTD